MLCKISTSQPASLSLDTGQWTSGLSPFTESTFYFSAALCKDSVHQMTCGVQRAKEANLVIVQSSRSPASGAGASARSASGTSDSARGLIFYCILRNQKYGGKANSFFSFPKCDNRFYY
ncbi:hypothetical protein ElyMa_005064100 [Elysia marginata]|uniref:Uncharacterized protein n=1 Tax=Elysia marginata TaxID=1093978 RepID=A0AAV4JFR7_9GAST|nr:hypothetical protein ElyMa_005064100 [Elysia marginata]